MATPLLAATFRRREHGVSYCVLACVPDASLAGWSLSQHDITREFHVPMVLRQFFVTLEHKAPLRPGPVGLAHRLREGAGLITADACEVVWQVLLQLTHRLPDLRDRPMGAEFGVAVAVHLAPSQGSPDKVSREPDTVRQNGKGGVRMGHIIWTQVYPLVSQGFDNLHHPVQAHR